MPLQPCLAWRTWQVMPHNLWKETSGNPTSGGLQYCLKRNHVKKLRGSIEDRCTMPGLFVSILVRAAEIWLPADFSSEIACVCKQFTQWKLYTAPTPRKLYNQFNCIVQNVLEASDVRDVLEVSFICVILIVRRQAFRNRHPHHCLTAQFRQ